MLDIATDFFMVVKEPARLPDYSQDKQELLIRMLKSRLLFGRVAAALPERGLSEWLGNQKISSALWSATYKRQVIWEIHQIVQATKSLSCAPIVLKGGAYELLKLPNAAGRFVSDIDILVAKDQLNEFEQALLAHGWELMKLDEYDQKYYRLWMHELPPLRHRERGTVVDVHHTITPETSRLNPNIPAMLSDAVPLKNAGVKVLCPEDMVLHQTVHLFYDGDFANSTRELVDLYELINTFSAEGDFWQKLLKRASLHGLIRPLYYALYQLEHVMQYPLPDNVRLAAGLGCPSWPIYYLINDLMTSCLLPPKPDKRQPGRAIAMWLMYVRSHWLKMPPLLLVKHLFTKWRRKEPGNSGASEA